MDCSYLESHSMGPPFFFLRQTEHLIAQSMATLAVNQWVVSLNPGSANIFFISQCDKRHSSFTSGRRVYVGKKPVSCKRMVCEFNVLRKQGNTCVGELAAVMRLENC